MLFMFDANRKVCYRYVPKFEWRRLQNCFRDTNGFGASRRLSPRAFTAWEGIHHLNVISSTLSILGPLQYLLPSRLEKIYNFSHFPVPVKYEGGGRSLKALQLVFNYVASYDWWEYYVNIRQGLQDPSGCDLPIGNSLSLHRNCQLLFVCLYDAYM